MDRRAFLRAAAVAPFSLALSAQCASEMPPIRYYSIPARDTSKVDCLRSVGYFGGTITIHGKEYGTLFGAPESEYLRCGCEAVERVQRSRVDAALREVWERLR